MATRKTAKKITRKRPKKKPARGKAASTVETKPQRTVVAAEAIPRRTLQQTIQFAEVLHNTYAGKSASWDDLATALQLTPKSVNTKYLVWSAQAYGIINKVEDGGQVFSLSETGRKIVAPTYEGEDREAIRKAILTPTILSKFYSDYDGHLVPGPVHLPNVLESRFDIPRERTAEAIDILIDNARYAGILAETDDDKRQIDLGATGFKRPPTEQPVEVAQPEVKERPAAEEPIDWSKVCFYITPISEDGSEVRKHADMMLKHLLMPVAEEFELQVLRADKIERSGLITQQIFEHLTKARVCIADLSFNNPNVFYELAVRHMCKLATIQLIRKGDKIPFDVSQGRTITVDTSDIYTVMDRFQSARRELSEHLKYALSSQSEDGTDDNPVHVYLPGLKVTLPSLESRSR